MLNLRINKGDFVMLNIFRSIHLSKIITLLFISVLLVACGGGGGGGEGGGNSSTTITGTVSAPGGAIAYLEQRSLFAKIVDTLLSPAAAAITGTSAVAGATVELFIIDNNGNTVGDAIATTTADAMGVFSVDTTESLSSNLMLRATDGGGAEMRALAISASIDIDPVTEFIFQQIDVAVNADPNGSFTYFSATEIDDLVGSIESLSVDLTGQSMANALSALSIADAGNLVFEIALVDIPNLAGTWRFQETSGANTCGDPVGLTETFTLTISQMGSSISIFFGGDLLASGDLDGNSIINLPLNQYAEDGGITTELSQTFTVQADNNTVIGSIDWSWSGPGGSCAGTNTVSIVRI